MSEQERGELPSDDELAREHDRYVLTERYVRDAFRVAGQNEDADDPRLVGRITSRIIGLLDVWASPDSTLRKSDEELERG